MGQAKLRGSREQRVNAALEAQRQAQEAADRAEREEQEAIARKWAAMTPEEQQAALARAKKQAESFGALAALVGHDAASVLTHMENKGA